MTKKVKGNRSSKFANYNLIFR